MGALVPWSSLPSSPGAGSASTYSRSGFEVSDLKRTRTSTRGAGGIGDPRLGEPPARRGGDLPVSERAVHGLDARGHPRPDALDVPGIVVGRLAGDVAALAGDGELQAAEARGAEVGVVDLAQRRLAQRERDRAGRLVRGAEPVLVGRRPRVHGARGPWRGRLRGLRLPGAQPQRYSDQHDGPAHGEPPHSIPSPIPTPPGEGPNARYATAGSSSVSGSVTAGAVCTSASPSSDRSSDFRAPLRAAIR